MVITIEEVNYHVQVKGCGYPLVCIHGFSENISTWKELNIHRCRLILIDLIGHGLSDRPLGKKHYALKSILRHIHGILAELHFSQYAILGYSMGGRIALAYVLKYSDEVSALFLESASYGECGIWNRYQRRKSDRRLADNIVEKGIPWFNNYWRELSIFSSQKRLSIKKKQEIERRRLQNSAHALANTLRSTGQGQFPCLKNKIKRLQIPILFLSGDFDYKYCRVGQELAALNSYVKAIRISNAGHNAHLENEEMFEMYINNFIEDMGVRS